MPKKLSEYRAEAEQINAQAQAQGGTPLIPNPSELGLKPLAKKVIQARLDISRGGGR
jgi:hypothetical protein